MATFELIPFDRETLMNLLTTHDSTPVISVDTTTQCFLKFVQSCRVVAHNNPENYDILIRPCITTTVKGKKSNYDILWFVHHPNYIYVVDVDDDTYIARMFFRFNSS